MISPLAVVITSPLAFVHGVNIGGTASNFVILSSAVMEIVLNRLGCSSGVK